ncbi:FHA domain-containing protein [Agromyces salentinus]|uniref:FHA domain-containing protein n=1 Tax=Agromyces salentinus TaxID=269421 RepID=A0ABN2MN50_9MICO|nr:FHA domain-containing protein [Agromyces salentinus]
MTAPEFIVPPPGLIPNAPDEPPAQTTEGVTGPTDRTVQAAPIRQLPSFTPLPTAPPSTTSPPPAPPAELTMPPAFRSPPPPVPAAAPTFDLIGADGVAIAISGTYVLGRNPVADHAHADARPIAVADPTKTVSKTHALIEVREGRVIVTDLHSTNGVAVQAGGGEVTVLDAGAPAEVEPGSVLRLGDLALTLRRTSGLTV